MRSKGQKKKTDTRKLLLLRANNSKVVGFARRDTKIFQIESYFWTAFRLSGCIRPGASSGCNKNADIISRDSQGRWKYRFIYQGHFATKQKRTGCLVEYFISSFKNPPGRCIPRVQFFSLTLCALQHEQRILSTKLIAKNIYAPLLTLFTNKGRPVASSISEIRKIFNRCNILQTFEREHFQ